MKFKDEQSKENYNKGLAAQEADAYGVRCFTYAMEWADLMEKALPNGPDDTFPKVAKETSHEADTDGISGNMYGQAVRILSGLWVHGEALRKWHNGEYGHHGEGVVNPAVLILG